MGKLSNSGS